MIQIIQKINCEKSRILLVDQCAGQTVLNTAHKCTSIELVNAEPTCTASRKCLNKKVKKTISVIVSAFNGIDVIDKSECL